MIGRALLTIALTAVIAGALAGFSPSAALGGAPADSHVEELWRTYPLEQTPTTGGSADRQSADLSQSAGGRASPEDDPPASGSGVVQTSALLAGAGALLLTGALMLASSRRGRRGAPPSEPPTPSEPAPTGGATDLDDASRPRFARDAGGAEPARTAPAANRRGPVCQVRWAARGRRWCFEAFVVDADGAEHRVARSPRVERPGSSPPEQTPEAKAALRALAKELRDDGWKPLRAKGKDYGEQQWYTRRFRRPVEVDDDHVPELAPGEGSGERRRNVGSR